MAVADEQFDDVEIHGPRVTLRAFWSDRDAERVLAAATDPLTQLWLPLPNPYTAELARSFCEDFGPSVLAAGTGILRAVVHDDVLVGAIDAKRVDWRHASAEVGYWSVPDSRGQGFMTEALVVFARWLLEEQQFERVELRIATGNVASVAMAGRAGFSFEGVARSAGITHHGRVDLGIHSLLRADPPVG